MPLFSLNYAFFFSHNCKQFKCVGIVFLQLQKLWNLFCLVSFSKHILQVNSFSKNSGKSLMESNSLKSLTL